MIYITRKDPARSAGGSASITSQSFLRFLFVRVPEHSRMKENKVDICSEV